MEGKQIKIDIPIWFDPVVPNIYQDTKICDGFDLVEEILCNWKKLAKEKDYIQDHVPMIFHIGTGVCNDKTHLFQTVRDINNIEFNDGTPIVINFVFNEWNIKEL